MAKGKRIILFFSIVIFAAIGITIIFAATSQENTATNVVTVGNVKIVLHNQDDEEVNSHSKTVMPGDRISKIVSVENIGDYAAYIRVKFKKEWLNNSTTTPLSLDAIVPSIQDGWMIGNGEDSEYIYYYYKDIVSATDEAIPFMSDYLVDAASIDNDTLVENTNAMGKITVVAEAVQADYYTPAKESGYIIGWPDVSFGADYVNSTPDATVVTQSAVSGSSVEFVGDSDEFVSFETGTDLFLNVKGLMPGQRVEQVITIRNKYKNPVEVYLYAKIPDDYMKVARSNTEWELLKELELVVKSNASGSGWNTIYEGSLFEDDDSKDMLSKEKAVLLGIFEQGEKYEIQASVTLPGSWDKAYCQTKIDWVFTTDRISSTTEPPAPTVPAVEKPTPAPTVPVFPTENVVPTAEPSKAPPTAIPESPKVTTTVEPTPKITLEPQETPIYSTGTDKTSEPFVPTETPISTNTPVITSTLEPTQVPDLSPLPTIRAEKTVIPTATIDESLLGGNGPGAPADYSPPVYTPEPPDEPKKPKKTESPTLTVDPDLPEDYTTKTGDETPILFWCIICFVSLIGVVYNGIILVRKR